MGIAQGLLDLGAVQARADALGRIRESEGQHGGFGHVLLELGNADFVEGVGHGVVVDQVVPFFLVGDEGGDTFEHEVEVVGTPLGISGEGARVELFERSDQAGCSGNNVLTAA